MQFSPGRRLLQPCPLPEQTGGFEADFPAQQVLKGSSRRETQPSGVPEDLDSRNLLSFLVAFDVKIEVGVGNYPQ
jgi:hypothetical protein